MLSTLIKRGGVSTRFVRSYTSKKPSSNWENLMSEFKKDTANNYTKSFSDFQDFYREAQKRNYRIGMWVAIIGGFFGLSTIGYWRSVVSRQAAIVTAATLNDKQFQKDSEKYVTNLMDAMAKSQSVKKIVDDFVAQTVSRFLESPSTTTMVEKLVADQVERLCKRDDVKAQLATLFSQVFQSNTVKDGAVISISSIVESMLESNKTELENIGLDIHQKFGPEIYQKFKENLTQFLMEEIRRQLNDSGNRQVANDAAKSVVWSFIKM